METKCNICDCAFANNTGGQLTNHLLKVHNISIKDYYVLTKMSGCPPVCICEFCEQEPEFYRGKFRKYAKGHNTYTYRETQYKIKYGIPKCKVCDNFVSFNRGNPNKYCSKECFSKENGFSLPKTQEKIKNVILEKYGVDNVSKLEEVKQKISLSYKIKQRAFSHTLETKQKIKENSIRWWKEISPDKKEKVCNNIKKSLNTPKEKERRRILAHKNIAGKNLFSIKNRFSKLHLKIRKEMCLEQLGFSGEQKVDRFLVDELNEQKKLIIEINGDYVHANPNKYLEDDIIRLRGNNYTAQEKWFTDKIKINKLQELGYKVFVVWESDNLAKKKQELETLLQNI